LDVLDEDKRIVGRIDRGIAEEFYLAAHTKAMARGFIRAKVGYAYVYPITDEHVRQVMEIGSYKFDVTVHYEEKDGSSRPKSLEIIPKDRAMFSDKEVRKHLSAVPHSAITDNMIRLARKWLKAGDSVEVLIDSTYPEGADERLKMSSFTENNELVWFDIGDGTEQAVLWRIKKGKDHSMLTEDVGGIDMNEIDVNRQGTGVNIQFSPESLEAITEMGIEGFVPIIIDLTPINSILPLLGLEPRKEEEFEVTKKS